jgi:hydroxymethylglutaryl-CoA lyase
MKQIFLTDTTLRDGIQTEPYWETSFKIEILNHLIECNFDVVEVASLVSQKAVPQMKDADQLIKYAQSSEPLKDKLSVLVPNLTGYQRAKILGLTQCSFLCSIDDAFNSLNVKRTTSEIFKELALLPLKDSIRVDIPMSFSKTIDKLQKEKWNSFLVNLKQLGFKSICFADTLGEATPKQIKLLIELACDFFSIEQMHLHFHNHNKTAVNNAIFALECGITHFDGTVGGLGGCPFTKIKSSNLSFLDFLNSINTDQYLSLVNLSVLKKLDLFLKKM